MWWDVVLFVVVVIGMASYWLVSSLHQRGLFRTLLGMLKGVIAVVTFGYFCASKVLDLHSQIVVSTDSDDDTGRLSENPYWMYKGSADPNEYETWRLHDSIRRGHHGF